MPTPPLLPLPWRIRLWALQLFLASGALTATFSACSPAGGYDVRAAVLEETRGGEPLAPGERNPRAVGDLLDAGDSVHLTEPGSTITLGLMPGTVATISGIAAPGGELRLDRLRLYKRGKQMLGREVDLTLTAGSLDLLIAAPEEAAPTTLRLRTPAGEIVAGPGCLARVRVEATVNNAVRVLCARGELRCAGERLSAGAAGTFPAFVAPHPVAGNAVEQSELLTLLESGAKMQGHDLERQARPPGWRSVAR